MNRLVRFHSHLAKLVQECLFLDHLVDVWTFFSKQFHYYVLMRVDVLMRVELKPPFDYFVNRTDTEKPSNESQSFELVTSGAPAEFEFSCNLFA